MDGMKMICSGATRNAENQGRKSGDGKQFGDSAASTLCAVITRANMDATNTAAKQRAIEGSLFSKFQWNMRILEEITTVPVMIAIKLNYDYQHSK